MAPSVVRRKRTAALLTMTSQASHTMACWPAGLQVGVSACRWSAALQASTRRRQQWSNPNPEPPKGHPTRTRQRDPSNSNRLSLLGASSSISKARPACSGHIAPAQLTARHRGKIPLGEASPRGWSRPTAAALMGAPSVSPMKTPTTHPTQSSTWRSGLELTSKAMPGGTWTSRALAGACGGVPM
jgi:hypothetical protein